MESGQKCRGVVPGAVHRYAPQAGGLPVIRAGHQEEETFPGLENDNPKRTAQLIPEFPAGGEFGPAPLVPTDRIIDQSGRQKKPRN